MKLFILLTFCLTFLYSNMQKSLTNESCQECQGVLPETRVEDELKSILQKVKIYKKEKKKQIITLEKKLSTLKKTFHNYRVAKKDEILQLKRKTIQNRYQSKKLKSKEKKIRTLQHELALLKKQLKEKKKIIVSLKEKLIQENQPILLTTDHKEETTPQKWIKITVDNNLNIYDLALKYYGDSQEYKKIYMANQNKIDRDYQIRNGMSLKIPITENFIEQPMFINTAN